eukprot:CAMPEP_0168627010 /NCGR_PEP_ID=MMETSP0449_2-20121227/10978_1 /TAXON_ID=1082188 /ORGANISM="Strombidium rassoulzadegani, Strain ras09" /LENGTH=40 /DNA_ID= /DNA_START= /DNA_END= /DNA_ORIENTATION=
MMLAASNPNSLQPSSHFYTVNRGRGAMGGGSYVMAPAQLR